MRHRSKSGVTLLLVMGILVLLVIIAEVFVVSAVIEMVTSSNYVYQARAQFAATSGLEYAFVQLKRDLRTGEIAKNNAKLYKLR